MTPSQYIKSKGLPSLVYVAGKVNKDPRTIYKWYADNFPLFEVVVAGVKARNGDFILIPKQTMDLEWLNE